MFSFFLNLLQRKICWGGNFQVLLERILSGKNGLPWLEGPRGAAKVNI